MASIYANINSEWIDLRTVLNLGNWTSTNWETLSSNINNVWSSISTSIQSFVYPIGFRFISRDSPASLLGGTWAGYLLSGGRSSVIGGGFSGTSTFSQSYTYNYQIYSITSEIYEVLNNAYPKTSFKYGISAGFASSYGIHGFETIDCTYRIYCATANPGNFVFKTMWPIRYSAGDNWHMGFPQGNEPSSWVTSQYYIIRFSYYNGTFSSYNLSLFVKMAN